MKIYKFKCDSCGSKRYIKTDDGFKCEYCGSFQDVIFQQEEKPVQSEPAPKIDEDDYVPPKPINTRTRSLVLRLILCLFAGAFGVHKFMEGRIFSGILYVFTGGLFGIGVFVDTIRYIIQLAHSGQFDGD